MTGQVGVNTSNPTETLHVEGTFRLVDGTQADNFVLTSDQHGVARWQRGGLTLIEGDIMGPGITIPANTPGYLQTGSSITLPPGKFLVSVNFLLAVNTNLSFGSNFWLRSSFSDSSGTNPTFSPDLVGGRLVSAGLPGSAIYQPLIGSVIINNTSGAPKTYYYIAGGTLVRSTTESLINFGGNTWDERSISALPIN